LFRQELLTPSKLFDFFS